MITPADGFKTVIPESLDLHFSVDQLAKFTTGIDPPFINQNLKDAGMPIFAGVRDQLRKTTSPTGCSWPGIQPIEFRRRICGSRPKPRKEVGCRFGFVDTSATPQRRLSSALIWRNKRLTKESKKEGIVQPTLIRRSSHPER